MTPLDINWFPSPSFNERPEPRDPDMIILHYTGMESGAAARERLCDPKVDVSSHYLIWEQGQIDQLILDDKRAWHAGVSYWQGRENINHTSLGIEIVNTGEEPFPERQIASVIALCQFLQKKYTIPAHQIIGHSDIAPGRKFDPGPLFPWTVLAEKEIGIIAQPLTEEALNQLSTLSDADFQAMLSTIGFSLRDKAAALQAFQLHWCPEGQPKEFCAATKKALYSVYTQLHQSKDC
ncbi:N-acetylmuramoyl-L-alanine amidase [Temperatibacter marinus]|uniref:N-acetylmuramoyl-L-alanine amidase n=1 Tax=Temperatibacter marinus TaxID=1456591 RepID=A0AA52EFG2_9PROT|nr:N-acetylmuramoyl-L-alanine amidase [Temperatibacter marinus]WND01557.1 N-acetylmuramoyl-L-alanine amidase [Temperatibacter marinus]